jgi:predicted TIM-barrel fold metal-dependent hydrolase
MHTIYNCHTHIFTVRAVPDHIFFPGSKQLLTRTSLGRILLGFLRAVLPGREHDRLDRLAAMLELAKLDSQEQIFNLLQSFYPEETRFVVLAMDMAYMQAGRLEQPYEEQLAELARLKQAYGDLLLPFVAADPRRPKLLDLIKRCFDEYGFQGIKLYPPLGYYPFHPILMDVYAYAEHNQIPVLTHCSRGGVYFQGAVPDELLTHPLSGEIRPSGRIQDLTDYYTDPCNYLHVLESFPNLKLCLGHFGAGEWKRFLRTRLKPEPDWFSFIRHELFKYPNVYADISFTAYDVAFLPILKVILQDENARRRVLFGSDFYLVESEISERQFSINVRAYLGEDDYWQIAEANPVRYLFPAHD